MIIWFVQLISSESLNLLWQNLIWWCIIMSQNFMQKDWCANVKIKVTVKVYIVQIWLSTVFSELLVLLQPNFVWWYIIMKPLLNIQTVYVNIVCDSVREYSSQTLLFFTQKQLSETARKLFHDNKFRSWPGLWSIQILSECCSSCGACYMSQKTGDIKRNDGEVWCKPSEARSFKSSMLVFKK